MTDQVSLPRSRRALLAAAAGGAAALAASAALPLTAAAHDPDDVQKGVDNPTSATTSVTNSTVDLAALAGAAAGAGYGLQGTSAGGAGVFAWSVNANAFWDPAFGAYTGVYGYSPTMPDPNSVGVGVWGESEDWGVFGSGGVGVYGLGGIGVVGESTTTNPGVLAFGMTANDVALDVRGKVKFSRSGRTNFSSGQSSKLITLAGVTTSSKVFAILHSNRSSRYVRAVVTASGRFRIYLNASVSSTTSVAWFVID